MRMRSLALMAVAVGAGCASSPTLDRDALPPLDRFEDEAAVVLWERRTVEFDEGDEGPEARSVYARRLLITHPRGRERGDFGTIYDLDFSMVESAQVIVHRPDGETETHPMGEWKDRPSWGGSSVYENDRALYIDLPDLPVGTVVDVELVRREKKADLFVHRFGFGGRSPHLDVRFEVRAPEGWTLDHRAMQAGRAIEYAPSFDGVEDGWRVLRWHRTDVAPVRWEPYAPPARELVPVVAVRLRRWIQDGEPRDGFATMADYAGYLAELQSGTAEPNAEIESIVDEVLADAPPDPEVKAARLYAWVQENIRYVSIQVGMGGWRPYPAAEVIRNRFGDCKDKATLLKSMLQVAGIESRLASLYAHDGIPHDFVLPGLGMTNHAILAIELPDRRIIVDPTSRTVPFGQLPVSDQGASLLLVGLEEEPVIRAPVSADHDNQRQARLRLEMASPGNWEGRLEVEARGALGSSLHRRLLGEPDDMDEEIAGFASLVESVAENPRWSHQPEEPATTAQVDVSFRQVGSKVKDRWLLRANDFLSRRWTDLAAGERATPVMLWARRRLVEEIVFELGGGRARHLPDPVELRSPLLDYRLEWRETDGAARLRRSLVVKTERVDPESYAELLDLLEQIRAAEALTAQVEVGGVSS